MLTFAVFESDSGFEEINERLSKFNQFHEITALEDNFPFRFCDSNLFKKVKFRYIFDIALHGRDCLKFVNLNFLPKTFVQVN